MRTADRMQLMKNGNVSISLFKMGMPMAVSMLVTALYNVVDTYFVSGLGISQVAAVSVAFPISLVFSGIGLTFGVGAGSCISRMLGGGMKTEAGRMASTALISAVITGLVLTGIFYLFITPILTFMGATETILPFAREYAVIFVLSTLFSTANVTSGNIAVSHISLNAMISGAVLNMILDPLLIYELNMGIRGAAAASLISQIITAGIYFYYFKTGRSTVRIRLSNFKPGKDTYVQIIKIGISMLLLQLLSCLSISLISRAAGRYGDEAVAAMGIALRITTLGTNVVFGYMKGFQPLAGFNYGAGNYERLKAAARSCIIGTTAFCLFWIVCVFAFAAPVLSRFSTDIRVLKLAEKALLINSVMFFTFGFQFTYSTLYLALGRALPGGVLSIARQGIFFIPVILLFPALFGMDGIIYAQPAADVLTTLMTLLFARKIHREIGRPGGYARPDPDHFTAGE